VFLKRESDVKQVYLLADEEFTGFIEVSKKGKSSISKMILGSAIVNETDHLISELTVLQALVGYETTQVTAACDQNTLEPNTSSPAVFKDSPNEYPKAIRGEGVYKKKQHPDQLGDLVCTSLLEFKR
tara:strand:- start:603 stop:983 length:381 start_codon:yes stop_codon:yes gene_type:complete